MVRLKSLDELKQTLSEVKKMVTFQKSQNEIRIEDIQHVFLNSKEATLFKVFVKHTDQIGSENWLFSGQYNLPGTIKRESTIKRKICF